MLLLVGVVVVVVGVTLRLTLMFRPSRSTPIQMGDVVHVSADDDDNLATQGHTELLMGGWMDGWIDGWVDGWEGGWMDGWVGWWMRGWMDGWVDGWMGGWMSGWMDGLID